MHDAAAAAGSKVALVPHQPSVIVACGGGRPPAERHVGETRETEEEAAQHWCRRQQLRPHIQRIEVEDECENRMCSCASKTDRLEVGPH